MERNNLLEVEHLSVHIPSTAGTVQAVRDVSFAVAPGEVLALVGESGCGKSILCKSVMKLLPKRASIVSGTIRADGRDITRCSEREMRNLRGKLFSMVFQDPLTALNPTIPIGKQIAEAVTIHQKGLSKAQVQERVIELMTLVGIAHPLERAKLYPHHFSGGMCAGHGAGGASEDFICRRADHLFGRDHSGADFGSAPRHPAEAGHGYRVRLP